MDALAVTCEAIAATSSRLEKVRLAAEHLKTLDDESIGLGACFLSGLPFARVDPRRARAGYALLVRAAKELTGWDPTTIGQCAAAAGDLPEAIGLLARDHVKPAGVTLKAVRESFDLLARASRQDRKLKIVVEMLRGLSPLGVKYYLKIPAGGLRIGLLEKQVEEAIALATGQRREAVGAARVRSGDIERVAHAARTGALQSVEARLFHPIDFMLASPVDSPAEIEAPSTWLFERKFDGIRAQAHVAGGRVVLYSRGVGDVTPAFPEIVAALKGLTGPLIIDGELVAMQGDRALPFQLLQRRLARKAPSAEVLREVQVTFIVYDLLHDRGGLLFDLPLEERQSRLAALLPDLTPERVRLSRTFSAHNAEEVGKLFEEAREAGDEGLILKRRGSIYEAGRRGPAWLKLKRALGTLDVVVTAAEQGHGHRASMLSDYTFAVRDGDTFVNVGKAYSGLTDEEIRTLTRRLQSLTVEKYGRVRSVRPEIVLEVAFDVVQKSRRHKSGFALRFPRIVRLREDKTPGEIDTLDRVRELYEHTINTGRVSESTPTAHSRAPGAVDDLPLFARRPEPR